MTYEEYLQGTDALEEEIDQLDADIENLQVALFRLRDVYNDYEYCRDDIDDLLEEYIYALTQQRNEIWRRINKYNEYFK